MRVRVRGRVGVRLWGRAEVRVRVRVRGRGRGSTRWFFCWARAVVRRAVAVPG